MPTQQPKRQHRSSYFLLAFVLLLSCLTMQNLSAQSDTGTIVGTATDTTGAVIVGASVTAMNGESGIKLSATTNEAGEFRILAVPRGPYKVLITAKGFQSQSTTVSITVATTQTVTFQLPVSGGATTVEVTTAAPMVDTEDATIGATIATIWIVIALL